MTSSNNQLGITIVAHDAATATLNKIHGNVQRLAGAFGSLRSRFMSGVVMGAGYKALNLFDEAMRKIVDFIPDLIHKGQEWAHTVHNITLITGMSAQAASTYAAIQQTLTGTTEGLDRALALASKTIASHPEKLSALGVATRGARGETLSWIQILDNARGVVSRLGPGIDAANLAQQMFGRNGRALLPILQLNNQQFALLADEARRAGLVLDEAGLKSATAFQRTQNMLNGAITGLGQQLFTTLAPALTTFVQGITTFIEANGTKIVQFLGQVVSAVTGFVSGLLGISFVTNSVAAQLDNLAGAINTGPIPSFQRWRHEMGLTIPVAKSTASGIDTVSLAIQHQIDAIDRQLKALDRSNQAAAARREHQQLLADIASAKAELTDLRSQSIFHAGMSQAEGILADQAHAKAIIDAQKRVHDAQQRLRDQERQREIDLQRNRLEARRAELEKELAAHQQAMTKALQSTAKATQGMVAQWRRMYDAIFHAQKPNPTGGKQSWQLSYDDLWGGPSGMTQALTDAKTFGEGIANAIKDAILGPVTTLLGPTAGGAGIEIRSGGLLDAIHNLADALGKLYNFLTGGGNLVQGAGDLVGSMPKIVNSILSGLLDPSTWSKNLAPNPLDGLGGLGGYSSVVPAGAGLGKFIAALALQERLGITNPIVAGLSNTLGSGSVLDQSQQDMLNLMGITADNTATLQNGLTVSLGNATVSLAPGTSVDVGNKVQTLIQDWKAGTLPASVEAWSAGRLATAINDWSAGKITTDTNVLDKLLGVYSPAGHGVNVSNPVSLSTNIRNILGNIARDTGWERNSGLYHAGYTAAELLQRIANNQSAPGASRHIPGAAGGHAGHGGGVPEFHFTFHLDRGATRDLLGGRHVTTTTRAAQGI